MHSLIVAFGAGVSILLVGLAAAALTRGWLPPWLHGRQSPRTSGLLWLGLGVLLLMNYVPELFRVPEGLTALLQHLALVPLLLCVMLAGVMSWRDRRRTRRSGASIE